MVIGEYISASYRNARDNPDLGRSQLHSTAQSGPEMEQGLMPKARVVDPFFWDDPDIAKLSRDERLLALGMITLLADDHGRLIAESSYLRKRIFGDDEDIGRAAVRVMRDNIISRCRNFKLYSVDNQEYIWLANWDKFQKIRWRVESKLPEYSPESEVPVDSSNICGSSTNNETSEVYREFPQTSEKCTRVGLGSVEKGSVEKTLVRQNAPHENEPASDIDNPPFETTEPGGLFAVEGKPNRPTTPGRYWFDQQHEKFYKAYWRHVGKQESRKAYEKRIRILVKGKSLSFDDASAFLMNQASIDRQKWEPTDQWDKWRKDLHPSTWLNGCRWEDEPPQASSRDSPAKPLSAWEIEKQKQRERYGEEGRA